MRWFSAVSLALLSVAITQPALAGANGSIHVAGRFAAFARTSIEAAAHEALRAVNAPGVAGARFAPARTIDLASGERIVKLDQAHRGLVVAHRGASITFGRDGVARFVSSSLEDDLPSDITPAFSADQAAIVARHRTKLAADASRARKIIWPTTDGNKLAWAVLPKSIPGLPYAPIVVVDAMSGVVIAHYNRVVSLHRANVYPTNPIKSPTLTPVTLPIGVGDTTLQNALVVSRSCVDQKTVKSVDVGFTFDMHVCDLLQIALPDANDDYLQAPGAGPDPEDPFAEISMFHHVNRAYGFFRGFDPNLRVNGTKPIMTISNLRLPQGYFAFETDKLGDANLPLAPFQNAFFAPSNLLFQAMFGVEGAAMWFGQGPLRDFAYDGDVVYHEFTHAVVDVTLSLTGEPHMDKWGTSLSPGAMNEALADYFSSAITGDPAFGEYAIGDYDPSRSSIRNIDNQESCPKDIGGEAHQDASLFSGALWDVRKTLGPAEQALFDGAVFTAMSSSSTGDLGYEDFAKILHGAVEAALGKPTADALDAAFHAHGVLPECNRILEATVGDTLTGPRALKYRWFAPGTQTTITEKDGWTPGVVQAHYKLVEGTTKLTISVRKVDVGEGGGPFGNGGAPFVPKFLVRFGAEPIQFTYNPFTPPADLQALDPTAALDDYTLTVNVPAGAGDVYVMIGSAGQADGAYTDLRVEAEGAMMSSSSSSGGATSSSSSSGSAGTVPREESSGCGCTVPGEPGDASKGAVIGAVAALGLVLSRRRRTG